MGVTGTYAEVFYLTLPEDIELDAHDGVENGELGRAFAASFTPLPDDEHLDADVDDNVF